MRAFLLQLPPYQPVAPAHHLADEAGVVVDGIEIPAAPQHEGPAAAALHLVGQRRCVVGADHLRHAAQFPESVLETLLQGQEGLPGYHLGVAPPRVAQHQLEQQMPVGPATDGDAQGVAVGEIDLGLAARWMLLGEVDFLVRSVESSPVL